MRLIFLLSALLATSLAAQEPPARPPLELRLLAFNSSLGIDAVHAHDPANPDAPSVATPIKTYLNHEFSTLNPGGNTLRFTTRPEPESATRPEELLGDVTLPAGTRSAILLFLPVPPGGKSRFKILPIDDSSKAFPAGSFKVFNLSPQAVRIQLETQNFDFKPGATTLIQDPPVGDNHHSSMRAFAFHGKQWQRIATSLWPPPGEARVLQILFQHPQSGQVQLRGFDDVPPRAAAAEP
ncbi:MAG: hypothetical protein EAZ84_08815 [Verrucomicrobia bacterium]|nr:MAG: hypothetical protein EAZ84_08815 [Verrucomicrobiota bacterium]TAE88755.1 MAG: hypothetical protein EAZ82_03385 [Verrucomicrobiota bacterium]TAF26556.1 MAG: hypothetical protein EAZ71_04910 [Verrucomicrobiota bacterium]